MSLPGAAISLVIDGCSIQHARVMLKAIGRTKNTRFQAFETLETYYTHNEKQLSGVDEQSTDWWICRDMVATEVDDQDVEGCYVGGRFVLAFDSVDRVEVVQGTGESDVLQTTC